MDAAGSPGAASHRWGSRPGGVGSPDRLAKLSRSRRARSTSSRCARFTQSESLRRAQEQLAEATKNLAAEVQNATGESPLSERDGSRSGDGEKSSASQSIESQSGSESSKSEQRSKSSLLSGGREQAGGEQGGGGGNRSATRPLTGDDFSEWSDQLRDIEEMLEDPELRNRVAQVRDRARAMRAEFKRHGEMPQWDLVKSQLLGEMQALQQRIDQEVARLQSDRAMVPVDREPVPEEFDSLVQRYYELLGQERGPDEPAPVKP